jgi:cyclopropane fatty-acyl-phospholipid synthase-like methyltransferase
MSAKQFSAATDRNKDPILATLRSLLADCGSVLEIGSGTGQHAAHFGAALPHLQWQPSDFPGNHASIRAWIADAGLSNVLSPIALDVASSAWPPGPYDAVFSANTSHIMSWPEVRAMFAGVGRVLAPGGVLCLYGPFNRDGNYTSAGNADFDAALKARAPHMGLRNAEDIEALAREQGLAKIADIAMPANNALLAWRRRS